MAIDNWLVNDGRWSFSWNWSDGVPTSTSDVIITQGDPLIDMSFSIASLVNWGDLTTGQFTGIAAKISGDVTNNGLFSFDAGFGGGGMQFRIGGTLTNNGRINFGNVGISSDSSIVAGGLTNRGIFNIVGSYVFSPALVDIQNRVYNSGLINIDDSYVEFHGGITGGAINLMNGDSDPTRTILTLDAPSTTAINFGSGASTLAMRCDLVGTIHNFSSASQIAIDKIFTNSTMAVFRASASGGTLEVLDTTNPSAGVTTITFNDDFAGKAFGLAPIYYFITPDDLRPRIDVTLFDAPWANLQPGDVLITEPTNTAVQEHYSSGGALIETKVFHYDLAGQPNSYQELDLDGAGRLNRDAWFGVAGEPYSAYEYDYIGGIFEGTKFTYAGGAGASYSSYVDEYDYTGAFAGAQYFYTNVTGQPYTGEEVDTDANSRLSRIVQTGVTGQAYSSAEQDYDAGNLTGLKFFYTNIAGQPFTSKEVDLSANGQLEKTIASGFTTTQYSSAEVDYSAGKVIDEIFYVTKTSGNTPNGQPYYAYQSEIDPYGNPLQKTFDLNSGDHETYDLRGDQTLTSRGDDTFYVGDNSTIVLNAMYGVDTINGFTSGSVNNTIVSMPTSEFADFVHLLAAATPFGSSDVQISAPDGDKLIIKFLTVAQLANDVANFTFHS